MSFIAGYILGSRGEDPRIKKLKAAPCLYRFDITDGWNVRFKIAWDIDNFAYTNIRSDGHVSQFVRYWTSYYCVYKDDKLLFSAGDSQFYTKRDENYSSDGSRLEYVYEYDNFTVESASAQMGTMPVFVFRGSCRGIYTKYTYNDDEGTVIPTVTESTLSWYNAADEFGHYDKGGHLINCSPELFKVYSRDFIAACRSVL